MPRFFPWRRSRAPEAALELRDARDRADGVEPLRRHLFEVLPLSDCEDEPLGMLHCLVDGAKRSSPPGGDREADPREQDGVSEGKNGKRNDFGHTSVPTGCDYIQIEGSIQYLRQEY